MSGKRSRSDDPVITSSEKFRKVNVEKVKCVLLDIEGTTTPITFVTDVLFPYARQRVRQFLTDRWDEQETRADVKLLLDEFVQETSEEISDYNDRNLIDKLVSYVHTQMDENRKTTPLKQLQGHIWRHGYGEGVLKGEMYNDVHPCLHSWTRRGYKVYIYSSGSVEAQKLIFGNSNVGNLLPYISGHYDTVIGSKMNSESYQKIADSIGLDAHSILFITDRYQEAVAAHESNMQVLVSIRPGNAPLPSDNTFVCIESFVDVRL